MARESMLEKLTRKAIKGAIRDFDRRGREAFLDYHGATKRGAQSYFICRDEKEYDLKAIVYVALLPGSRDRRVGNSKKVAKAVANLKFTVIHTGEAPSREGPVPPVKSSEGKKVWRKQKKRERCRQLATAAIKRNKEKNGGRIRCEACRLTDEDRSMFDAHHLNSVAAGERVTNVNDIAVLCPTCHRWAHAKAANRLKPLPIDVVARARRNHR